MEMRDVLYKQLERMMERDESIVVIDADLAKANGTQYLREIFPERALDVGVAEQNMASIAAGLASYGFQPVICSFTPFVTRRICDQIAISIAYAKQNVKIIGTDPGISAQLNGGTHMSVEDIGVLRSIPNLVIFEPVDNVQFTKAFYDIMNYRGPVYIRMFRKEVPQVFNRDYEFELFKADVLREGRDITLIASGMMVYETLVAAKILSDLNIDAEVINVHTIKPIDKETILKSVRKTKKILTCENHNIIGGLKSAVCEAISDEYPARVVGMGIEDSFGEVGQLDELKHKFKMTADDIVTKICDCFLN